MAIWSMFGTISNGLEIFLEVDFWENLFKFYANFPAVGYMYHSR